LAPNYQGLNLALIIGGVSATILGFAFASDPVVKAVIVIVGFISMALLQLIHIRLIVVRKHD
jgi:hypothetical protein